MPLRFLTEELGFESMHEAYRFLLDHGAESSLSHESTDDGTNVSVNAAEAHPIFVAAASAASSRIDIKGQI